MRRQSDNINTAARLNAELDTELDAEVDAELDAGWKARCYFLTSFFLLQLRTTLSFSLSYFVRFKSMGHAVDVAIKVFIRRNSELRQPCFEVPGEFGFCPPLFDWPAIRPCKCNYQLYSLNGNTECYRNKKFFLAEENANFISNTTVNDANARTICFTF